MIGKIFCIILITINSAQSQGVDLTEVVGSTGVDVVNACLQRLSLANTFSNDFNFLERIALVESNFGETLNANSLSQGIWKITPEIYQELTSISVFRLDLAAHIAATALVIGLDNVDLTNSDFSTPIRSAFAARLFIQLKLGDSVSVPATLAEQSTWWSTEYNAGGTGFVSTVEAYEAQAVCTIYKLDLWLLVDGSGSIGPSNFAETLDFVEELSTGFDIEPDKVRVGFTVYSSQIYTISTFNQYTTNSEFEAVVRATNYPEGGTETGKAISYVVQNGFNVNNGARPLTDAVPRILVVLTDGESGDDVLAPSNEARDNDITVYAVGVGRGFKTSELDEIGNDPNGDHVYGLSDFDELLSVLINALETKACTASAIIQDLSPISVTIEVGQIYYSSVIVQSSGLCTLTYEVVNIQSSGTVYISTNLENPSSAVYDFFFDIQVGTTEIVLQATDVNQTIFEYVGQNYFPNVFNRKKRQIDNNTSPKMLYTAVKSTGTAPLDLTIEANRQVNVPGKAGRMIHSGISLTFCILFVFVLLL